MQHLWWTLQCYLLNHRCSLGQIQSRVDLVSWTFFNSNYLIFHLQHLISSFSYTPVLDFYLPGLFRNISFFLDVNPSFISLRSLNRQILKSFSDCSIIDIQWKWILLILSSLAIFLGISSLHMLWKFSEQVPLEWVFSPFPVGSGSCSRSSLRTPSPESGLIIVTRVSCSE